MTILNWEFIQQYLPLYEKAAWLTLRLGVMGILLSIAVGLACAVIQYEKIPVLRRVVAVYIEISRNTPLLIQLFFLYYGLPKIGIRTSPAMCGVAGLAFLGGSYMAEAFRSGLEAVEPIQRESAFSLGMTRTQAMAYVVLPQAVSIARKTMRIVKENIVFAIGIKFLVLGLSAIGRANMWMAVFADVGVCILAILNAGRMLRAK